MDVVIQVRNRGVITLPADLPSGTRLELVVAMYHPESGSRLAPGDPSWGSDAVDLGPVELR